MSSVLLHAPRFCWHTSTCFHAHHTRDLTGHKHVHVAVFGLQACCIERQMIMPLLQACCIERQMIMPLLQARCIERHDYALVAGLLHRKT
jgi:hypothetical protein